MMNQHKAAQPGVPGVRWIAPLLCLTILPPALMAQTGSTPQQCQASHWSAPQLLEKRTEDGFEVTVPSMATNSRGEVFIAGRGPNQYGVDHIPLAFPFAAYKLTAQGERSRLPAPAHEGVFSNPRVVIVHDTVHIFWGEADSTAVIEKQSPPYPFWVTSVRGIWGATYGTGAWSKPRFLASYSRTDWIDHRDSNSGSATLPPHLLVAGEPVRTQPFALRWLGTDGSAIIPDLVSPNRLPMLTPWIVYAGPTQIVIAYGEITGANKVGKNRLDLSVVRSSDNGQSWSSPIKVAQGPVKDITLVHSPDGILHAIWLSDLVGSPGFDANELGYAISRDLGETWTEPTYFEFEQPVRNPRVVADRESNLHLVYQSLPPDKSFRPALYYTARAPGSNWSEPALLFGDTVAARHPELTSTSSGDLVLLLSKYLGEREGYPWFASAIARLRPGEDCVVNQ